MSTTLLAGMEVFRASLEELVGDSIGTRNSPIRKVFWGQGAPTEVGIPFIAMQPLSFKRTIGTDNQHTWEIQIKVRVVFNVSSFYAALEDLIRHMTLIENHWDAVAPTDGLEGGEDAEWSVVIPEEPSASKMAYCESLRTLMIDVERGTN